MTPDAALMLAGLALDFARVERVTRHQDGKRPETDADRTVMLQLLAVSFAQQHFPTMDRGLVALFALVHDLPEVEVGDVDTFTDDPEVRARKDERERDGRERLARRTAATPWISELVERYERQQEPEARLVGYFDKLCPRLTNVLNHSVMLEGRRLTLEGAWRIDTHMLDALAVRYPELAPLIDPLIRQVSELMLADYADRLARVPTETPADVSFCIAERRAVLAAGLALDLDDVEEDEVGWAVVLSPASCDGFWCTYSSDVPAMLPHYEEILAGVFSFEIPPSVVRAELRARGWREDRKLMDRFPGHVYQTEVPTKPTAHEVPTAPAVAIPESPGTPTIAAPYLFRVNRRRGE